MATRSEDGVDLRQYSEILKRHWRFIVVGVIGVAVAAALVSSLRTPIYVASARVLLRPSDPGIEQPFSASSNDPDRRLSAQQEIVRSEAVASEAAKSVRGATAAEVLAKTSVKQRGETDVLEISAADIDPVRARDIANAVAKGYIENRRQNAVAGLRQAADQIEPRFAELLRRIAELDARINNGGSSQPAATVQPDRGADLAPELDGPEDAPLLGVDDGAQPSTEESLKAARYAAALQYRELYGRQQELLVDISLQRGEAELISAAKTPQAPVRPRPKRDAALGGFVGLLLGSAVALLREQLDDRLRSSEEIEQATGLPVLAEPPYDEESAKGPPRLAAVERPKSPLVEAVRSLRTSIQFVGGGSIRTVLITSTAPNEGKSLLAANLAAVYAQGGARTCLVSADLRRPRLTAMLNIASSSPGLTDLVVQAAAAGDTQVRVGVTPVETIVPDLFLLPPGSPSANPAELLAASGTDQVLDELRASFDMVVVDAPPLLPVTDAAVLSRKVDAVVVVAAVGEARRDAAQRANTILKTAGARVLGVVVNKTTTGSASYYLPYDDDGHGRRPWRRRREQPAMATEQGQRIAGVPRPVNPRPSSNGMEPQRPHPRLPQPHGDGREPEAVRHESATGAGPAPSVKDSVPAATAAARRTAERGLSGSATTPVKAGGGGLIVSVLRWAVKGKWPPDAPRHNANGR